MSDMVLGSHAIISAYGFWLPNDPRGSWSDFVASWELFRYGRATRVNSRRSVAAVAHDAKLRWVAKTALKRPPVQFSGLQARGVARGFADCLCRAGAVCWAAAILPDHAHLVLARYRLPVEKLVSLLKQGASRRLLAEDLHPFSAQRTTNGKLPSVWARGVWKVFLDSAADIRRAIRYVEENPIKERKRPQRWSFVTPFGVWERDSASRG